MLEHRHHCFDRSVRIRPCVFRTDAESFGDVFRRSTPKTKLRPSLAQNIKGRDTFGDMKRMMTRHHDDAKPQANALRSLAHRGQHHVRRSTVTDLDVEMLLCDPDPVETRFFRLNSLFNGVQMRLTLGRFRPRLRNLQLDHVSEFHSAPPN